MSSYMYRIFTKDKMSFEKLRTYAVDYDEEGFILTVANSGFLEICKNLNVKILITPVLPSEDCFVFENGEMRKCSDEDFYEYVERLKKFKNIQSNNE